MPIQFNFGSAAPEEEEGRAVSFPSPGAQPSQPKKPKKPRQIPAPAPKGLVCYDPKEAAAFREARKILRLVYHTSKAKVRELTKAEHLLKQFFLGDIDRQHQENPKKFRKDEMSRVYETYPVKKKWLTANPDMSFHKSNRMPITMEECLPDPPQKLVPAKIRGGVYDNELSRRRTMARLKKKNKEYDETDWQKLAFNASDRLYSSKFPRGEAAQAGVTLSDWQKNLDDWEKAQTEKFGANKKFKPGQQQRMLDRLAKPRHRPTLPPIPFSFDPFKKNDWKDDFRWPPSPRAAKEIQYNFCAGRKSEKVRLPPVVTSTVKALDSK